MSGPAPGDPGLTGTAQAPHLPPGFLDDTPEGLLVWLDRLVEAFVAGVDGVELSLHLARVAAQVRMVRPSHGAAISPPPRTQRVTVGSLVGTATARRVTGLAAHGQPRVGSVVGSPVPGVTSSTTTSTGPPTRVETVSRT